MPEEAVIDAPASAAPPIQSTITDADSDDAPPGSHMASLNKFMSDTLKGVPPSEPAKADDTRPVNQPELKTIDPKAKPEKAPTPDPKAAVTDAEKEPATFTSPSAANFKKIVAERDDWKKKATDHETAVKTHAEKLAAAEKEYAEYKAKTAIDPKEIEALKKEHEEAQARLARVALQETPKFREHFDSRFEAATNRALDAVGKDKAEMVKAVLEAPKSQWRKGMLNELVTGMENEVDKLNLIAAVNEYDQARDQRGKELDKHRENLRELKAVEQKEAKEKQDRELSNRRVVLDEALKQAAKFESFQEKDDTEHNLTVAKNKKLMEDLILRGDVPTGVYVMLPALAAEGERLQKVVPTLQAKITELEAALQKYQQATPTLEGQGAPKTEAQEAKSYMQQVEEAWPGTLKPSR